MTILALNPGSSTLKFALFEDASGQETPLARGSIERIGTPDARLSLTLPPKREPIPVGAATPAHATEQIIRLFNEGKILSNAPSLEAVVCRVVHGGAKFIEAVPVTPDALKEIRALAPLAPLHNPIDADVIEAALSALPNIPTFAVFDTAFHHTISHIAALYALPHDFSTKHALRRYGFHGISHRYVSGRLLECIGREAHGTRLITCHLGNGASVCAIEDGESMDTSMGLTPLEGLVMGTRSGDVDPGLLLYLLREKIATVEELDDLLNHQSGMLGLSGISADVRDLELAAARGQARAELALRSFAYRVRKYIGAYAAALGGVDAIAFTGGIGEHSASLRRSICQSLLFLGVSLQDSVNKKAVGDAETRISLADSPIAVWVIPTDEEKQMTQEARTLLASKFPA